MSLVTNIVLGGASNVVISDSSDNFVTTSLSQVQVTGLSLSIETTGGKVKLYLIAGDPVNGMYIHRIGNGGYLDQHLKRNGSDISVKVDSEPSQIAEWPAQPIETVDSPPAGLHTYTLNIQLSGGTQYFSYVKLVAEEL